MGWDHDRCMAPMQACSNAWTRDHPEVEIVWHRRSLAAFGDQPLEEVASEYDLLVIDHPFCGVAAATGCLRPLDDLLPAEKLSSLAADAVGPSHASYQFHGHQWGLATDAACQVSAIAPEAFADRPPPGSWDEVLALARREPRRVALPLAPAHAVSSYLTLCANYGAHRVEEEIFVDAEAGEWAAGVLLELAALGPGEALDWEPPDALARLTHVDELLSLPLTYGYITYSTPGAVRKPCRFVDIPSREAGPVGAVLGGAGLAVSAASAHPREAAAFAAWATGADAQRRIVATTGGQPGSRTAWEDGELDAASGWFYSGTRATIEAAWVRPREAWWPAAQLAMGTALTDALRNRGSAAGVRKAVEEAYCRARRAGDHVRRSA